MTDSRKFKTFKEFWPEYLRLHSKPVTRAVHYAGTLGGVALVATGAVMGAPLLIAAAPVFVYSVLFPAHPLFEKNRPATLKNPLMSVGGDFRMLFCFLTGRLKGEYKKHGLDYTGKTGNNQNDPAVILPPSAPKGPSLLGKFKNKLRDAFKQAKDAANDNAPKAAPAPVPKAASGPKP